MLKPPLVSDEKPALLKLPPMTPALSAGTPIGIAARERQQLDVLGLDRLSDRDLRLQRRRLGRNRDFLGQRASFEREVERQRTRCVELDVRPADLLEPAQLGRDLVFAGCEVRKCVEAAPVGDGAADLLCLSAGERDGDAGNDPALRVLDCSGDRAAVELCECRRRYA